MKRDDDRIASAPGCYIMHQLIGDRMRRRSTLDDGSKATICEVIIILVSDSWRCASRKLKKGRENRESHIRRECSTVFDRGVAFTFRSHAQAYHPGGDIFVLTFIFTVALYPRLCALFIHFHNGFSILMKRVLIPSGNALGYFFLSRVLIGQDSRNATRQLLHRTLHLRRVFLSTFFFKTMFPIIIMFFTFLNCVKWREYLIMGFFALSVLMILLGLSVTSFLTILWYVGKNGVKARSSW